MSAITHSTSSIRRPASHSRKASGRRSTNSAGVAARWRSGGSWQWEHRTSWNPGQSKKPAGSGRPAVFEGEGVESAAEPARRLRCKVATLGRLDHVEEGLVDRGLPRGGIVVPSNNSFQPSARSFSVNVFAGGAFSASRNSIGITAIGRSRMFR